MASKKLSTDTSLANSYKLSRGVASVARPSAPTIGTATDGGTGNMSVTFTASTLGPTASSFSLTSSSGVTGSGASSPLTLQEAAVGTYTYSVSGVNANGTGPSSAASNSVVVASVSLAVGAYDSIATYTVSSTDTTLTFSSIPATYTHLQVRAFVQQTRATYGIGQLYYRFNADTGSNYANQYIYGDGSTTTGSTGFSQTYYMDNAGTYAANAGGTIVSIFGTGVTDIFDYANTSKYKTMRSLSGVDLNGTVGGLGGRVGLSGGLWMNTNAISSITILPSETNFRQYTKFALYGIKGN